MRNFLVVGTFVLLLGGAGLTHAWTGPTGVPPNNNVSAPINVGTVDQVKNAGLSVNALAVFGNSILSGASRYLNFGTILGTSGYGFRDNAGVMEFKNSGGSWVRPITGSGTTNYLSKFTSATALGSSLIFDNGTNVGIGDASPSYKLDVAGTIQSSSGGFRFPDATVQTTKGFTGWERRTNSCSSSSCTATCTSGKNALGGGCSGSSAILYGYPNTSSYTCLLGSGDLTAAAYVICADVN